MSLVALCSAKGSPGATTAALALASSDHLQGRALVAELDPDGGDLSSRLGLPSEPGLASLAAAGRHELRAELLDGHLQRAGDVDLLLAPAGASAARAALSVLDGALVQVLRAMPERVVICDLGRLGSGSPVGELAAAADLVLVVTRPTLTDLAHLAEEEKSWHRLGPPVALVLSGEPSVLRRERYPADEVSSALGIDVLGTLAWDPKGVAAMLGRHREMRRSALVQSTRALVATLVQRLPGAGADVEVQPAEAPLPITGPAPAGAEL
jgi:MinD superfamily P-loop ATPase